MRVVGASPSLGLVINASSLVRNVSIDVAPDTTSASACAGVAVLASGVTVTLEDVAISVLSPNCSTSTGIVGNPGSPSAFVVSSSSIVAEDHVANLNDGTLECTGCEMTVNAAGSAAIDVVAGFLRLNRSSLTVLGGGSVGVKGDDPAGVIEIDNTLIDIQGGTGFALEVIDGSVSVTHSRLFAPTNGFEFDVGASGSMLWTEMTSAFSGDLPQRCEYNITLAGSNPCG